MDGGVCWGAVLLLYTCTDCCACLVEREMLGRAAVTVVGRGPWGHGAGAWTGLWRGTAGNGKPCVQLQGTPCPCVSCGGVVAGGWG